MRVLYLCVPMAAMLVSACDSQTTQSPERLAVGSEVSSDVGGTLNEDSNSNSSVDRPDSVQEDNLTPAQRNAVRSAEQYLNMTGFSRDGLIQQLSSDAGEGYSVADATAAVDSLDVDWNENAAKSARQYLEMSGFSCKGLIQQLSSSAGEKYTVEQATYGARQAGAC